MSKSLTKTKLIDPLILTLLQNIKVQRSKLNDLNCIEVDPKLSNIISNVEGKELYIESKNYNNNTNLLNRFVSTYQKSNQIILMLGNQTCPISSYEYLPLKILESHLSYGMSSVLFKLFRERNGLTYEVGVYNPCRKENSPFLIYFSVSNKNALLAFEILSELWRKLLSSSIIEKDIHLAKIKLKSSFLMSNQTLNEILYRKIQYMGYSLYQNDEFINKINHVNSADILKVTKKYFKKPFLSISGDEKICNEINKLWIRDF